MTKLGTIELFFRAKESNGKLRYTSATGAYVLLVPRNKQTEDLTYRIEIELMKHADGDIVFDEKAD